MGKFSLGQQLFTVVFMAVFLILLVVAYRRDSGTHRRHYRGVRIVFFSIVVVIFLLYVIKVLFYN